MKKYRVTLSSEKRASLTELIRAGKASASDQSHARILTQGRPRRRRARWSVPGRIAERLEIHHTPKHGRWLNMAEIELSVLSGQSLGRRIESRTKMEREIVAWEGERNERSIRSGLAVHHRRRPHQAPTPLPVNSTQVTH